MTRREEIQKLIDEEMGIDNYGSCDFQVGVIYGVKHADKTMIDKACEWLKKHYAPAGFVDGVFRKAMEE